MSLIKHRISVAMFSLTEVYIHSNYEIRCVRSYVIRCILDPTKNIDKHKTKIDAIVWNVYNSI